MNACQLNITAQEVVSLVLAIGTVLTLTIGLYGRVRQNRGIGWQFIRFSAIAIALPLTGILALNDALSAQSATILAGALGYAFGNTGQNDAGSNN